MKLALASIDFWCRIQHQDGTFDEWYPNEHSHVATSFSMFAVAESLRLLQNNVSPKRFRRIFQHLKRAANWLIKNEDLDVINHEAGSAAALYTIYELSKDEQFRDAANEKLNIVLKSQSSEGWFPEYGGADVGYLSLCLYYLGILYAKTKNEKMLKSFEKAIDFVKFFFHPDFSFGGEYNSRDTEFYIPTAFEILSDKIPFAKEIANVGLLALKNESVLAPYSEDDRYICYDLYRYLQACDYYKEIDNKQLNLPLDDLKNFFRYFNESKLLVVKTDCYYAVVGGNKGGVLKIFNVPSRKLVFSDCGYVIRTKDLLLTTQKLDYTYEIKVNSINEEIQISGEFNQISQKYSNLKRKILFYLIISFGEIMKLSELLKKKMRKLLIHESNKNMLSFCRKIKFLDEIVEIKDKIIPRQTMKLKGFKANEKYSWIFSASANQFSNQEHFSFQMKEPKKRFRGLEKGKIVTIFRKVNTKIVN